MVEILRSKDQTGPLWWRFSSAIVALYSLQWIIPVVICWEMWVSCTLCSFVDELWASDFCLFLFCSEWFCMNFL